MRNFAWLLLPVAASIMHAAASIATLSSIGPVNVGGVKMAADSVVFWPLAAGDVVNTLDTPAVLVLRDQSRITLSEHSTVRIDQDGNSVSVKMMSGGLKYDLTSLASARFYWNDRTVPLSKQGQVGQPDFVGQTSGSRRTGATSPAKPTNPPSVSPIY